MVHRFSKAGNITASGVVAGDINIHQYGGRNCVQLETSVRYVNNTKYDIVIATQDGLKTLLPKRPGIAARELVVQKSHNVSDVQASRLSDLFTTTNHPASSAVKKLKDEFEAQLSRNTHGGMALVLTSRFDEKRLEDGNGVFYCVDLDIVISILSYETTPSHPHSSEPDRAVLMESEKGVYERANFGIEYIDNEGTRGKRYFKFGDTVVQLKPMTNRLYNSGIRFFITNAPFTDDSKLEYFSKEKTKPLERIYAHYAFMDYTEEYVGKKFGLYKTPEEAKHCEEKLAIEGKSQLAKLDFDNAVLNKETQEAAQKTKQRQLELEKQLIELASAHSALKVEHEREERRLRDYYETKAYRRKDTSEGVKFLPALLTGMAAVFGTAWALL